GFLLRRQCPQGWPDNIRGDGQGLLSGARHRHPAARAVGQWRERRLMDIAIYVAIAENGVIGREGGLPWRLSNDLKRFKADPTGKPIIMGRKTYEGIGKPLPGRLNIVVTRDKTWRAEGVEVAHSLDEAITL